METRDTAAGDLRQPDGGDLGPLLTASVTAGDGTAEQKSWNLARPVTLVGRARHMHIRIDTRDVEPIHAALLNLGDAIVLVDLASRSGVYCGGQRVRRRVLQAKESFRLGTCLLKIDMPQEHTPTAADPEAALRLPHQVGLVEVHTGAGEWATSDVGAVIGRRAGCDIRLARPDVSPLCALLTRVGERVVVASLAERAVRVDGEPLSTAELRHGDVLTIWPLMVQVSFDAPAPAMPPQDPPEVESIRSRLERLDEEMADSAKQLAQWQEQLDSYAHALVRRDAALTKRAEELDELQQRLQQLQAEVDSRTRQIGSIEQEAREQRNRLDSTTRG